MITRKYIENRIEFSVKSFKKKEMTVFFLVCAVQVGIDWDEEIKVIDMLHRKEIPFKILKSFKPLVGKVKNLEYTEKINKQMAYALVKDMDRLLNSIKSFPDRITGEPKTFKKLYEIKRSSEI